MRIHHQHGSHVQYTPCARPNPLCSSRHYLLLLSLRRARVQARMRNCRRPRHERVPQDDDDDDVANRRSGFIALGSFGNACALSARATTTRTRTRAHNIRMKFRARLCANVSPQAYCLLTSHLMRCGRWPALSSSSSISRAHSTHTLSYLGNIRALADYLSAHLATYCVLSYAHADYALETCLFVCFYLCACWHHRHTERTPQRL